MRQAVKSKKVIVPACFALLVIALLVLLVFVYPITPLGQHRFQAKARSALNATFAETNRNFEGLPKQGKDVDNSFCNELQMRELDPGEKGWIKECGLIRITSFKARAIPDLESRLESTAALLKNNGWQLHGEKLPQDLDPTKPTFTSYIKREAKTRCYINFSYEPKDPTLPPTAGTSFDLYESCYYYYRSPLDI